MTLTLTRPGDLHIRTWLVVCGDIYRTCKYKLRTSNLSKVIVWHTDTTKIINHASSRAVKNKQKCFVLMPSNKLQTNIQRLPTEALDVLLCSILCDLTHGWYLSALEHAARQKRYISSRCFTLPILWDCLPDGGQCKDFLRVEGTTTC